MDGSLFPGGLFPVGLYPAGTYPGTGSTTVTPPAGTGSGLFPGSLYPPAAFPAGLFPGSGVTTVPPPPPAGPASGIFPDSLYPLGLFPDSLYPTKFAIAVSIDVAHVAPAGPCNAAAFADDGWGVYGPNASFDCAVRVIDRNNMLFTGHIFTARPKPLGNVRMPWPT